MSDNELTMWDRNGGDAKGRNENRLHQSNVMRILFFFFIIIILKWFFLTEEPTEKQTVKSSNKLIFFLLSGPIKYPDSRDKALIFQGSLSHAWVRQSSSLTGKCNRALWTFWASRKAAISRISSAINIPAIFSREEAEGTAAAPICRPCCYDRGGDVRHPTSHHHLTSFLLPRQQPTPSSPSLLYLL